MSKNLFSLSLLAALFIGGITPTMGQALQASQNFESVSTTGISYTGAATVVQYMTPNNGTPGNTRAYIGSLAWNLLNTSGQPASQSITFKNIRFANGTINNYVQFRLGALGAVPNQGLDIVDNVTIELSADYGATFYRAVTVTGTANRPNNGSPGEGSWTFDGSQTATGAFNGAAPASTTNVTYTPTGRVEPNPDGYGTVRVNLTNTTNVVVRITLTNDNNNEIWAVDDFGAYSSAPVVLPVTLTSFTAARQGKAVAVNWATATEKDNAYFEVLRSNDGKSFQALGRVEGRGTTNSSSTYTFTDPYAPVGLSYYQLRQVDTDGATTLSSVVVVSSTDELQAAFYPNPSNSSITLPAVDGMIEYRVYSLTGQVLLTGKGLGNSSVGVQNIPVGIYILELAAGDKRHVQRFARQ